MSTIGWVGVDAVERARPLFELLSEGVWVLDGNACTTFVNRQMAAMLGYSPEEMNGRSLLSFMRPELVSIACAKFQERQEGRQERHEFDFLTKSGSTFSGLLSCSPISGPNGEFCGSVAMVTDITERKRAELAERHLRERFEYALGSMNAGVWDLDLVDHTAIRSLQHDKIFGYDTLLPEWSYEVFLQHVHPDDRAELEEQFRRALLAAGDWQIECRICRPDGAIRWIAGSWQTFFGQDGLPVRMIGAVRDITEWREAQANLEVSERRLRQALAASKTGIFDYDGTSGAVYWSPELHALFDLEPDERPGLETVGKRIHPEDRARYEAAVRVLLDPSGTGTMDQELRIVRSDGSIRWHHVQAQTFFAGEGASRHAVRTIGAVRDITERKKAIELRTILAALVDKSRDFVGLASVDEQVTYLNPAAQEMVGLSQWTPDQPLKIRDLLTEETVDQFRRQAVPVMVEKGWVRWEGEFKHTVTGLGIPMDIQSLIIRNEAGAPIAHANISRNLTEERAAEAQRQALEAELRQAHKMEALGRLAGGIAHNFNNTLSVILGSAELLANSSKLGPADRQKLDRIFQATDRSRNMVRQLLGFSRRQEIKPKPMDLNSFVDDLQGNLGLIVGSDIEVCAIPGRDVWTVRLDESQLQEILLNLAANARDAMPRGGKLTWQTFNVVIAPGKAAPTANPGEYVGLRISDTGEGMDAATQERVFEPFFTTKPEDEGTGLGLSTVQGIVQQNGGFIRVSSALGQGTSFTLYFPRCPESRASTAKGLRVAGRQESTASHGNLLLVEDNDLIRENTAELLEAVGYAVLRAEGPTKALQILQDPANSVDLILSDIVMPEMRGTELGQKARELRPNLPILFMSGHPLELAAKAGQPISPEFFLQKPFSFETLQEKLAALMGSEPDTRSEELAAHSGD